MSSSGSSIVGKILRLRGRRVTWAEAREATGYGRGKLQQMAEAEAGRQHRGLAEGVRFWAGPVELFAGIFDGRWQVRIVDGGTGGRA